ncbi:O-antigen ligase family protein [Dyadobacter sandarakinus]|uniref:O-antigen ligase family protein n=1 Tax=Dyadobacter sandarakinus TaxID=2747268 RepID=A0ABX7IBC4_9BACT|nr:O-antigen ligase family protein [Dyadobacter sandarakinus]QRR03239.1 O-antigen ligase family protein [Dyadobacter sandarakinus]
MHALIVCSALRCIAALAMIFLISVIAPSLLDTGESEVQTIIVLAFFVFCALTLASNEPDPVFGFLSIPVLTQFIHLFEKYDFPAGAMSIWRLLPFLLMLVFLFDKLSKRSFILSKETRTGIAAWILMHLLFLLITPKPGEVVFAGCLFYILLLPLSFLFLQNVSVESSFLIWIENSLCLLFFVLGLGTIGLVVAGSQYKGSTNLLVTRNIADTNVTMAYFILLWPFVLLYCRRNRERLVRLAGIVMLLIMVVISFSRGSVLLMVPYLLLTLTLDGSFRYIAALLFVIGIIAMLRPDLMHTDAAGELAYSWKLRIEDFMTGTQSAGKLHQISGRSEIHATALRIFYESPVIGSGISSFEVLGPGYREAHSLFYTLLAEEGILGTAYFYFLLYIVAQELGSKILYNTACQLLFASFIFYLIFNHTVGSVFVILPRKSLTINCIAPILILGQYFYAQDLRTSARFTG